MKQRGIAAALAIFFGGVGAHKFYLNKPGQAVFYLLFCWTFVPTVLSLLEGLNYAFMSNKTFDARFNHSKN